MLRTLSFSVAFLSLLGDAALAQEQTRFLLVNGTNYPIRELVVSPHDMGTWSQNVLRGPALKPGERREVVFDKQIFDCNQDFKVVFADDASQAIWRYLNMCELQKIRLNFDRMSGVTTASYDE
ncbi:hypothetical protein [Reyranella sp.]|uniref:hypothetical protein n=1 Tax=Reyranella sp. TaxID=1929291 RepID=UPI003D138CAA